MTQYNDIPAPDSLELSPEQLASRINELLPLLQQYFSDLPDAPAWESPTSVSTEFATPRRAPDQPQNSSDIFGELFARLSPSYTTSSPGYMAYVPGGGLPDSAIADLFSNLTNRFVTVWHAAPALIRLEIDCINWFNDMIGYPSQASGYFTTGGSMANWSSVLTARRNLLEADISQARVYTSDQAHHSVMKAAIMAGFHESQVAVIQSNDRQQISVSSLSEQIQRDREGGLTPFYLCAHAGTTNTGAVDPLNELSALAKNEGLWLHIDAAYGGFFMMTDRGQRQLSGINEADSITLDPHKGLFLPYGTGCLLVKNREALEKAHRIDADYLPPMQEHNDRIDFCQTTPELSRDFRGLRVWLPVQLHGWQTFRDYLNEKLDLIEFAYDRISQHPNIEIVGEPSLSTLAFRYTKSGLSEDALNNLNQELHEDLVSSRRFLVSHTMLKGKYVIRICILCFRTHQEQVSFCADEILRIAQQLKD